MKQLHRPLTCVLHPNVAVLCIFSICCDKKLSSVFQSFHSWNFHHLTARPVRPVGGAVFSLRDLNIRFKVADTQLIKLFSLSLFICYLGVKSCSHVICCRQTWFHQRSVWGSRTVCEQSGSAVCGWSRRTFQRRSLALKNTLISRVIAQHVSWFPADATGKEFGWLEYSCVQQRAAAEACRRDVWQTL